MNISKQELAKMLHNERFPKSNAYNPEWVAHWTMGPNVLWLTEWLCKEIDLKPGMRVLDMGCGRGLSSVFLAKEYGVKVWANDLWIPATEIWDNVREAGMEDSVFPIHAEAHALPYAHEFFDAIVSIDSYHYYGTDALYLSQIANFLKPGGQIGIVVPGRMQEVDTMPEHLRGWVTGSDFETFQSTSWWEGLWRRSELVEIEKADTLEDGCKHWMQYERALEAAGTREYSDIAAIEADQGRYMGFVRLVARKKRQD